MIAFACIVATATIAVASILALFRLARGPDVLDRILALDTLVINTIGLIVILGVWYGSTTYFEAALFFAMVGFLTTVALCKFLLRGNIIE